MPELPEVERVARTITARIVGRRVVSARLLRSDVCESTRAGRPVKPAKRDLLADALIADVRRRGKQLAILADDGRTLCVHLGMTGQLTWSAAPTPRPASHVHAIWSLETDTGKDAGQMLFRDPRRFGGLWTFESFRELERNRWTRLGPDALSITDEELGAALSGTARSIKAALLDQQVLAGVGNIYADESLFRARIGPRRSAGRLNNDQVARLGAALRRVLADAIVAGGSTLRDFTDAESRPGAYQNSHLVYGRGGQPCPVCGRSLKAIQLAQRTTVFCPICQRRS